MKIALLITGALFIIATLLPRFRHDHWIVRDFDFPHVQITVVNFLIFILFFIFVPISTWSWLEITFMVMLTGCLIYQGFIIYPYTPIAKLPVRESEETPGDNSLSFMVTNVLMTNRNAKGCLEIIADVDPDVLLMVETDQWWCKQMQPLKEKYEHFVEYPEDNTYGMLLYSKLPIEHYDIKFLVEKHIPSIHAELTLPSGQRFNLHCVHPEPPSPSEAETSTERDAELLIVGKKLVNEHKPTIVAGDLNDVAWSYTTRLFIKVSRLLDPRMGRGFFSTFHAKYRLMRWPLDHVFISPHFKLLDLKCLPYYGSDHFPIYIALNYEPAEDDEKQLEEADAEDEALAEEKIQEVK